MTNGDNANTPESPEESPDAQRNNLLKDLVESSKQSAKDFDALLQLNRKLKDHTISQDAMIKPIELISSTFVKFGSKVFEAMTYLDKLAVSNSDISLDLVEMAADMSEQLKKGNIKYGTISDHLETEIALQRIGIKGVNVGLRDSIVLLNKQGNQGEDLIKLMAEFSAKGASQETLEKMAMGIADISENTSTQARAAIRALEQLEDVQGVLSVMGLDQKFIDGITKATKGMAPQWSTALGEIVKELYAPEDPAKLHLYGMGPLAEALRNKPFDEFMKMLKESAISAPQQFAKFLEPLDNMETMGMAIGTFGGDMMNSMITLKGAFEAVDAGFVFERDNADKMKKSSETYGGSLIFAADTIHNAIMAGSVPATKNLQGGIAELNDTLLEGLPAMADVVGGVGGLSTEAGLLLLRTAFKAGTAAAKFMWGSEEIEGSLKERLEVEVESDKDTSLRREASRHEKFYEPIKEDITRGDLALLITDGLRAALLEGERRRTAGGVDMGQVG